MLVMTSRSASNNILKFKRQLTPFVFQILTSVLQELTTAVPMLCAITPKDLTAVLVIRDTLETDENAKVWQKNFLLTFTLLSLTLYRFFMGIWLLFFF